MSSNIFELKMDVHVFGAKNSRGKHENWLIHTLPLSRFPSIFPSFPRPSLPFYHSLDIGKLNGDKSTRTIFFPRTTRDNSVCLWRSHNLYDFFSPKQIKFVYDLFVCLVFFFRCCCKFETNFKLSAHCVQNWANYTQTTTRIFKSSLYHMCSTAPAPI